MDEEREGYLVPLCSYFDVGVELAELSQPEALVEAKFGDMVVVLSTKESVDAHCV